MNHQFFPFVLASVLALAYVYLSSRILLRRKGEKISWKPVSWKYMPKTEIQDHLVQGVLGFGVGIFIFDLADRYIRFRFYGNPSDKLHVAGVIQVLCSALLGGVVFGLLMSFEDSVFGKKRPTKP